MRVDMLCFVTMLACSIARRGFLKGFTVFGSCVLAAWHGLLSSLLCTVPLALSISYLIVESLLLQALVISKFWL